MVIKNVSLETVCGITSPLPQNNMPEIALAGKSNVGKSSLINSLVNKMCIRDSSYSSWMVHEAWNKGYGT